MYNAEKALQKLNLVLKKQNFFKTQLQTFIKSWLLYLLPRELISARGVINLVFRDRRMILNLYKSHEEEIDINGHMTMVPLPQYLFNLFIEEAITKLK